MSVPARPPSVRTNMHELCITVAARSDGHCLQPPRLGSAAWSTSLATSALSATVTRQLKVETATPATKIVAVHSRRRAAPKRSRRRVARDREATRARDTAAAKRCRARALQRAHDRGWAGCAAAAQLGPGRRACAEFKQRKEGHQRGDVQARDDLPPTSARIHSYSARCPNRSAATPALLPKPTVQRTAAVRPRGGC